MSTKLLYKIMAVLMLAALILSACAPAATPAPTTAPEPTMAPKPTEAPKQAEAPKPTDKPTAAPPPTEVPPTEAPAVKDLSGKLLVWVQKINMEAWQNTVLPKFQEMYPNLEIEFVNNPPQDVADQVGLAIQGGTGGPDLFVTGTEYGTKLVDLGGLMDLTDFAAPYMDQLNPTMLAACTKDGKVYCVPWDIGPMGTFYRRDVFEAAGLPSDPESVSALFPTWEDMLATCKTIKEKTGLNCFSLNKANNEGYLYEYMLSSQGLGYFNDQNELTMACPENVATLEKLKVFWDAGLVSDTQVWTDPWYAEFANPLDNKDIPPVALITIPAWMGGFLKGWIAPDAAGNWGVAEMPAFTEGGVRAASGGGSSYYIPEASTNPEAAYELIKFLNLDPANNAAIYAYADIFPAVSSAYEDPVFQDPDPYFGDQKTREFFASVAKKSPTSYFLHPYGQAMHDAALRAIQSFALGNQSAEDALKDAADAVALETGMTVSAACK
jgi:lactose/L-arabinose transport system substrate-binding protein